MDNMRGRVALTRAATGRLAIFVAPDWYEDGGGALKPLRGTAKGGE